MKSCIILILLVLSCAEEISQLRFLSENGIDNIKYKIYSMVWSAKYYNPGEKQTFFFAIPMTFDTYMSVDSKKNVLSFGFPNISNGMEMFKIVKEEAIKAQASSYSKIINFSSDYTHIDLNINMSDEYKFQLMKVYQNKFSKSIQIKITQPNSKNPRALYVTFDFAKGITPENEINTFLDYLNYRQ